MVAKGRGRKRSDTVEPKQEVPESLPPPRPSRERGELDPETLWDKEVDENAEDAEQEGEPAAEVNPLDEDAEEENFDDLDDWDHPLRRLKIN